ncbi:gliding motility lipoprotein GldH [Lutibacter sp.]|uniref:gliding motility lipoprotein GldH n=1 Tax=Lutibacter sp. TaxID=1925666 RepID=UPI0025BA8433|nr:gliding motility lipoprotein GldH [Lutibacter sp.]
MKTTIKIHKYLLTFISALLLFSCNSNMVFDEYKSIENHQWNAENKINFIVSVSDTISTTNVFINIRNNKNYEFSSLFLIAEMEFPNGYKVVDTLEYEMADVYGNWLGAGFTDIKENKLFYKENVVFSKKGDYKFNIQQATRSVYDIEGKNTLKGITDVGLRIEKVKE